MNAIDEWRDDKAVEGEDGEFIRRVTRISNSLIEFGIEFGFWDFEIAYNMIAIVGNIVIAGSIGGE
jgi:hypothetical protein